MLDHFFPVNAQINGSAHFYITGKVIPIVGVDRGWKVWNALSGVREERRKAAEIL